ncbi:MAG: extracellular solute-binding protein [Spirochaetia bacterium]|nr:extracellular solute-binding protein [Spirochaetia bacterium]
MRNLFLITIAALTIFTQLILFRSGARKDIDIRDADIILNWATYPHFTRYDQAKLFREWLKKNGHPNIAMRIDGANIGAQKAVVQGVTGVAADVIDNLQGSDVHFLHDVGLLADLTDMAKKFGHESNYYPGAVDDVFIDGRRYAYHGNIGVGLYYVNKAAFEKVGIAPPPFRNDFQTFRNVGLEYTRRANKGVKRQEYFYAGGADREVIRRTAGVSWFNETLTRGGLDNPRYAEVLKHIHRWTFEDHILPTAAEISSFAIDQGVGGPIFQLFYRGNFAMMYTGIWAIMQLRVMGKGIEMSAVEPPNGGYPVTMLSGRCIVMYQGTKQREAAEYFYKFLGSSDYNMNIIAVGDSSPPDPAYLERTEFLKPVGYTNEWEIHEIYARAQKANGQGREYSPFASASVYLKEDNQSYTGFMSGIYTAEKAAEIANGVVNKEIDRYLRIHPERMTEYNKALERQKKIDEAKKAGKKIPLNLVDNTFLKRYYRDTGLGE